VFSAPPQTILVASSIAAESDDLRQLLEANFFRVIITNNFVDIPKIALSTIPDLLVLIGNNSIFSELVVCREIRTGPSTKSIPIMVLSSADGEANYLSAFDAGVDHYVVRPVSPSRLLAQIRAALRSQMIRARAVHEVGLLVVNLKSRQVVYDGAPVNLTPTEFRIVQILAASPGEVFSRDEIATFAAGTQTLASNRVIDAHIKSIRRKLGDGAADIQTVHGFGYRLLCQAA
jgi:two-component system, OmpR family, alkaline phosphatase synthesis response regulator PhoP